METLERRVLDADVLLRDAVSSGAAPDPVRRAANVRHHALALVDSATLNGDDLHEATEYVGRYEQMAADLRAAWPDPQP
jgi:hypothetical protein